MKHYCTTSTALLKLLGKCLKRCLAWNHMTKCRLNFEKIEASFFLHGPSPTYKWKLKPVAYSSTEGVKNATKRQKVGCDISNPSVMHSIDPVTDTYRGEFSGVNLIISAKTGPKSKLRAANFRHFILYSKVPSNLIAGIKLYNFTHSTKWFDSPNDFQSLFYSI